MKAFHEVQPGNLSPESLRNELESRGYVLIRGLLPRDAVDAVLKDVTDILAPAGWLLSEHPPTERRANIAAACGDPDPGFKNIYQQVFNLESFHSLPHQPALRSVMEMIAGDQILVHPKPIGRLIFPHCERLVTHAHQDYEFMGGDPEFFTVWIPFHDCPVEIGPLRILEGSHRFGIQKHERENLHVPEIPVGSELGDDWVGGHVGAGDVLLFHSMTVHAAAPNLSDRMRLSLDCRFQDARRILHPSNLVFAGESGKSWEKTYSNWQSGDLKYYWKNIPLTLKPTKADLEQLAQVAETDAARSRYARMAGQLS